MKKTFTLVLMVPLIMSSAVFAAEGTWTGKISDDMCGASHAGMEHGSKKKADDRQCTLDCVKGGSKFVFVSGGKVYNVENQTFAGLREHAGHTVKLTGEMSADKKSVKVSKIEMPPAKTSK